MRGSLEDLGGDREYISLLLSGFRSEVPNCQPLVRIWLEEIFCFSCSGFLKVGISNNDLRIGTLHINIWLAAFKKKNQTNPNYLATLGSHPNSRNGQLSSVAVLTGRTGASNLP